jgi:hypothetical protein
MSWSLHFAEPIVLVEGTKLASRRESIAHLVRTIPAAERRLPAVFTAAEMFDGGGRAWRPRRICPHRNAAGA